MPMSPREMIRLLKKNGLIEIGQNGSHRKFRNEQTGKQTIMPVHSKELKKNLEREILRQAGLIPADATSTAR